MDEAARSALLAAMAEEWRRRRGEMGGRPVATIYFGGGTPSLLRAEEVAAFLALSAPLDGTPEITIEANPKSASPEWLAAMRRIGVNRLSLGVQSFDDAVLRFLGRAHRADEAVACVKAAREAGFDNLSLDLILATAPSSMASLGHDLDILAALSPEHVSAYLLGIEEGTPFGRRAARGERLAQEEEQARAQYLFVRERLTALGYAPYEISSYARPGCESRHNSLYWSGAAYLGLGPGAHSYSPAEDGQSASRSANTPDPADYVARLAAGQSALAFRETLAAPTLRKDTLMTALRRREGLSEAELSARGLAGFSAAEEALFARFEARGLAWRPKAPDNARIWALTPAGWLISDALFGELFACIEAGEQAEKNPPTSA